MIDILKILKINKTKTIPTVYLILRQDLNDKYSQGSLCLDRYQLKFNENLDFNYDKLIAYYVSDAQSMIDIVKKLINYNNNHASRLLFSSIYDSESKLPTAICFYDRYGRYKKLLKEIKLIVE